MWSKNSLPNNLNLNNRELGISGEQKALEFLQLNGYSIIQKNFSCNVGEIDIIGIQDGILCFIEVKARWTDEYGLPEEAITPWKIRKIIRTGQYFKLLHPGLPESLRVDAVCIDKNGIRLIKNISGM